MMFSSRLECVGTHTDGDSCRKVRGVLSTVRGTGTELGTGIGFRLAVRLLLLAVGRG